MSHTSSKRTHTHCQNCEAELRGPYCHVCGQKDFDFHQSFGHVVHEMVETWLHLDHSFFHGVYNILFRLGKTTREFNAGKRARHVPPFRFYLVISLFFFFLILPGHHELEQLEELKHQADSLTEAAKERARRAAEAPPTGANRDAPGKDLTPDQELNAKIDTAVALAVEAQKNKKKERERAHLSPESDFERALKNKLKHPVETASALLHGLPKALLACLPFFALATRLLYRKSGYVYIQHLILAFNLHSFVFLWWSTTLGWSKITELIIPRLAGWVVFAAVLFTFWTYYKALKDVFGRSWRSTLVLGTITGMVYSVLLVAAIITAAILVFVY